MTAAVGSGVEGGIAAIEFDWKRLQLQWEFLREFSKLHGRMPLSVNEVPIPAAWTACSSRTMFQNFPRRSACLQFLIVFATMATLAASSVCGDV
jgi:hypothetical protein